jgi:hypothetical protein
MMTGRFFSWNNVTDFFYNRRGSATIWLIAAICFVTVFLGIVFLLSGNKMPDRKPPTVPAKSEAGIREPIKSYAVSNKVPVGVEKPDQKPDVVLEKKLPEKPDHQAQGTLNADPSSIQDVLPEDPPGKGVLAQDLNKQEPSVSPEVRKTPEPPSSLPPVKPPLPAENSKLAHKQLDTSEEKPTPASPPEVSASSEKTPAPPTESPADMKSGSAEEDVKELTVMVVAGNVREGPSVKEAVIFRIARGDKLQMTDQKGNWYAVHSGDGQSGWAHRTLFNTSSPPPSKTAFARPKSGKKGVIQGIRTVVTDPNHAQIIFELNGYYPPEIMVMEGESPRIVCDFFSVRLAPGVKKNFPVKTGVIKRVRIGIHKGSKPKVRVVLDLNAGQNYAVEQFFFEKENYYALMVNSAK